MKTKRRILVLLILTLSIFAAACAVNAGKGEHVTKKDVIDAQKAWGDAIVAIGTAYSEKGDFRAMAEKAVDSLYAYDKGPVLFKPTKASEKQFRLTKEEAVSYFVTGVVPEDHGFALQPWRKVRFENAGIILDAESAVAMGNYYFTDAETGKETKAEFTFGYVKGQNGRVVINLHHSSFPYKPRH